MLTIECPNCQRVVPAPEESGDHCLVCPGCNAAFTALSKQGDVRVLPTAIRDQPLVAESSDAPLSADEPLEPAQWISPALGSVEDDAATTRIRRLRRFFPITSLIVFGVLFLRRDTSESMTVESLAKMGAAAAFIGLMITWVIIAIFMPEAVNPDNAAKARWLKRHEQAGGADEAEANLEPPERTDAVPPSPTDTHSDEQRT